MARHTQRHLFASEGAALRPQPRACCVQVAGFTGKTLKQARVWVDDECDKLGIARDAGIPKDAVRPA